MAIASVGGGYQVGDGNVNEVKLGTQAAPQTATATATLTVAQVTGGILAATPAAAATYTLPTVASLEAALVNAKKDSSFDLSIINLATTDAYDITVAVGTGWTLVGDVVVNAKSASTLPTSAQFRARKTGASAWTLYRLG